MSEWRPAHTLLVRVGPLSALPGGAGLRSTVAEHVSERVADLARELGLPLAPHLEVVLDELPGVEISSDGEAVTARQVDLEEAWRLVAPPEGEPVPFGWDWPRWAGAVAPHPDRLELVAALVAEVVAGLVERRPDRLLTVRQAVAYLMRHGGTKARQLAPETLLQSVLPTVAHGIGIGEGPRVLEHLANGSVPERDRVEGLFADLRTEEVEVRIAGDLGGPFEHALGDGFGLLGDHLLDELGVRIPGVVLAPDEGIRPRCLRVRVNSLTGRPHRCLPEGTVMVDAAPDRLAGRFGNAVPVRNPATGDRCSVVEDRHAGALRAVGRLTWDPPAHALLTVGAELRRRAAALVDVRTVEYELALLHRRCPDLVVEALEVLALPELTEVARDLVREGAGVADLRLVLERLVAFAVLADPVDRALLADRPPWLPAGGAGTMTPREQRTQFVRVGMREHLAHRYADGTGRVPAILVADDVVERLRQHRAHDRNAAVGRPLSRAELDHLRGAVEHLRAAGDPGPRVLLTAGEVRACLASLLVEAIPDVSVLAFEELPRRTDIAPRGELSLAGVEPAAGDAAGAHVPDD